MRMTGTTEGRAAWLILPACAIKDYDHIAPLREGDVRRRAST